ncbi:hypothetical protein [Emcibacter sp.]|uniref:hypothetical protein n=1 Tax=Emcibacter sp. TaxID=1979954 RepID=UPI003A8F72DC
MTTQQKRKEQLPKSGRAAPKFRLRPGYKAILLASCMSVPLMLAVGDPAEASAGYIEVALAFAAATPDTQIDDIVTNPVTGEDVRVIELIKDNTDSVLYVLTETGDLLLTRTEVGQQLPSTDPDDDSVYQIVAVHVNGDTGLVESVDVKLTTDLDADPPVDPVSRTVVEDVSDELGEVPDGVEGAPGDDEYTPPTTNSGAIKENSVGAGGKGGKNAYGIRICAPSWLGGGCLNLAKQGSNGEDGKRGPAINRTVTASHGDISTVNGGKSGIEVTSTGGRGGTGGDSYGNIPAYRGGNGGNGGTITLNNQVNITTSGDKAHGIRAISRSGTGGVGGDGFIFAPSGDGGNARVGGTVRITNSGTINTSGENAHGIYVLSVGGAGGSGGSGWGIVGSGGSGAAGGTGGDVYVTNHDVIHTRGVASHGILAQSIGGTGGNGGDAGGIVSFGGDASTGGRGGNVDISMTSGGFIQTDERYSIGIFGQSVGGSGGDSGAAGGIVSLGASAGSGNDAGRVTITTDAGSQINTLGEGSVGIFGQSVGGGGGSSSATGGAVTIGGSGGPGADGSTVTINSGSVINTEGNSAYAIFGQSVGGGGGSASGSGGIVSLGGSGSAGGHGGTVNITNKTEGILYTLGESAHGIFAQSVGGGGGAGGASGGLVSLGGKGSSGGNGGTVTVNNRGTIYTEGLDARGIFAESIGGGGGSGGGSGGLFSLGGGSGTGSHASTVTVTNHDGAHIVTLSDGADAIFAQSIGGGGGSGASSGGLFSLGGSGNGGGSGGRVQVTNEGNINTAGKLARGIFAQSVGGGGGSGGHSGGLASIGGKGGVASNSGRVTIDNTGHIRTTGESSTALHVQSIGGGGGDGGNSGGVFLSVGGTGGTGGDSGDVDITHGGIITTTNVDSLGIFAQAVGGGGGNGGSSGSGAPFVGIAVGGDGSRGGNGGQVSVTLEEFDLSGNTLPSNITTSGDRSTGILMQSVGGGGGNGGGAVQVSVGVVGSVSVAVGGDGGAGGAGGDVDLQGNGRITTSGQNATGALLQSVGGGGGNGGTTVSVSAQVDIVGSGGGAVGVSVGGSGGDGGEGGVVTSDANLEIKTSGDLSTGFITQSVGGGGGNGGTAVSAVASFSPSNSAGIAVGIGGEGGKGGDGGVTDVTLTGAVETSGNQSAGVIIQSVGGGGGNGGMSVAASASVGGAAGGAVSVGVGGSAGDGGDAGQVTGDVDADILTEGDGSAGLIFQAVGGGGGNGGLSIAASAAGGGTGGLSVSVGVGGSGGKGGDGDIVTADYSGLLETTGDNSIGVLAQSVGGGGGNGGGSIAAGLSGSSGTAGAVNVGLGGDGGVAGDGGREGVETAVDLTISGQVVTRGENSAALVAQSIGGGGGNGGYSISAGGSISGQGGAAVSVGIGGDGGGGGAGKGVDASSTANLFTFGNNSIAFLAQSVGGGGGSGGYNVSGALAGSSGTGGAITVGLGGSADGGGAGGNVTATSGGTIWTEGEGSSGFVAQSIGGGGGNGGFNVSGSGAVGGMGSGGVSVGIGGSGGGGGNAGSVTATTTADVTTLGDQASAILAQSIGGGGGNGGMNVSAAAAGSKSGSGTVSVGIGGSGGDGGDGGAVTLDVSNNVATSGQDATAILVQSLGGGGGNGALNVSAGLTGSQTGSGGASVGIGGSGGKGGDSSTVDVDVEGDVTTTGDRSGGLLAQSLGGGGGNGGMSISGMISVASSGSGGVGVSVGGSGGDGGDAGAVTSNYIGTLMTTGDEAAGVLAQSVGGGGGNGGLSVSGTISASNSGSGAVSVSVGGSGGGGGDGADVTNNVTGKVVTLGETSEAILTQSVGGGGGKGGISVSAAVNLSKSSGGSLGVGVGGFGGDGGDAGNVSSTIVATDEDELIGTAGKDSSAIVAQSIGGSGGNGGTNVTASVNLSTNSGGAIGVGVGGFGGGGGDAGTVDLDVTADVVTEQNGSAGLFVQSLGGGGGKGGTNVTGTLNISRTGSGGSAAIGVGGFGGGGGNSSAVNVTYEGTINTATKSVPEVDENGFLASFEDSKGIFAQSQGGSGGSGGVNVSGGLSFASSSGDGHALVVGVGGFGGGGGDAGAVNVTVNGGNSITTALDYSTGIYAQSAGGGGGIGAVNVSGGIVSDAPLIFGVGGFGGDAGQGEAVTVNADTSVTTSGRRATAIFAESRGGGGGDGGLNVSGAISIAKDTNVPSLTMGVGGFGGAGNISGDVTVDQTGDLTTDGEWSHGIHAASIAGGGGNGALNVSGNLAKAKAGDATEKKSLSIVAGLGGFAGDGADAGNVSVESVGNITASGDNARGIFAQSLGGGGGTGGMNVTGNINTNSSLVSIGVGGFGGGGGHAGDVSVVRGSEEIEAGTINTDGLGAYGIEASSIGGGGGDAGMNFIAAVSYFTGGGAGGGGGGAGAGGGSRPTPKHTGVDDSVLQSYNKVLDELEGKSTSDSQDTNDQGSSAYAVQLAIGGDGGDPGHGASSTVENHGDIVTKGASSHGILAQSIGGGGGNAAFNLGLTYLNEASRNKGLQLVLGGSPGEGGNGGIVGVNNTGDIETFESDSFGVLAQSIGGGGGNASLNLAYTSASTGKLGITLGREGGTGGFGGDVSLTSTGIVKTHGNNSYGLLAQSAGNGGGNSSSSSVSISPPPSGDGPKRSASLSVGLEGGEGGYGGNVTLDASGWVSTEGENAHAIFAQSVGGGGGNGGSATGLAYKASTASLALGGTGGLGGYGGVVSVTSAADVRTNNTNSIGIFAQSVGGGGGTGGMTKAGGIQDEGAGILVAVGGTGGTGAEGGIVTVDNSGVIITDGIRSHGVLAQSLGGGGGNAGMVINSVRNSNADGATQLSMSVGGDGGVGAIASDVTVTNTGGIGTNQENSIGILAQSIGGGGGNADRVITGSSSSSGTGNKITMGIGGTGGEGGAGGNVNVSNLVDAEGNPANIITNGNRSHGIYAMSIGGGGGIGSSVTTMNQVSGAGDSAATNALSFSLGGDGGTGGASGDVTVENAGNIITTGHLAHGIIAQSVGGGGGDAGMTMSGNMVKGSKDADTVSAIAVGGSGGDGNISGDVYVENSGSIEVFGNGSYGIFAQSVGGGGGNASTNVALSNNVLTNPKQNLKPSLLNIGIGGSGGDGADSGNVLVNHTGSIISHGDDSYGIFAQSIGGGGGTSGTTIAAPAWMALDFGINQILGSNEGSDGVAGTVTINTEGDIVMEGSNSTAHFAQSINGGGGNANLYLDVSQNAALLGEDSVDVPINEGLLEKVTAKVFGVIELGTSKLEDAGATVVDATHIGDLYTLAENSVGSQTQSVGGGGGNSNIDMTVNEDAIIDLEVALGGSETTDSGGGDVQLTREGDIGTAGDNSTGTSIQSIGGGGGRLNLSLTTVPVEEEQQQVSGLKTTMVQQKHLSPLAVEPAGAQTTLKLGADGSSGNNGGLVDLALNGNTQTEGDRAQGMIIQSIGGGGGDASLSGLASADITLGGRNGNNGTGGNITFANVGEVRTAGSQSHGIILQSIGGGGGAVFSDLAAEDISLTLSADNQGDGGDITFSQTGDVIVEGENSIALMVQSLGGGGGVVDRLFMGSAGGAGTSGTIMLDIDGDAAALATGGVGVLVQSEGQDGQGDINVTLAADQWISGGAEGVGLWMSGGADNQFVNHGSIMNQDGASGMAMLAGAGNEMVDNYGFILGQVDLGSGTNGFFNHTGATFAPGAVVSLGDANFMVINEGVLAPGGMELAQSVALTGSYQQTADAVSMNELDFASDVVDQVLATGTVDLGGELVVSLLNKGNIKTGDYSKTLFSADQGLTDHGVSLLTQPSQVITYDMVQEPNGGDLILNYSVDFIDQGASNNLQSVGGYLNNVQDAGSAPELAPYVGALVDSPDEASYRNDMSQVSPDFYAEQQNQLISGQQDFGRAMMSCRQAGGQYRFTREGSCIWMQSDISKTHRDAYGNYKESTTNQTRFSIGVQKTFRDVWSAGLAVSWEKQDSNGNGGAWRSTGRTKQVGLSLKYRSGPAKVTTAVSYGWNSSTTYRAGYLVESFGTSVDREVDVLGMLTRLAYDFESGSGKYYARPMLDLGMAHVMTGRAEETGAGAISLVLSESTDTNVWLRPGLELGTEFQLSETLFMRFFGSIYLQHYLTDGASNVKAGFASTPSGVSPMSVAIEMDRTSWEFRAGVDFVTLENMSVRLQYSRLNEDHAGTDSGLIKLAIPF